MPSSFEVTLMKPRQDEAARARARRNKMDLIVGYFKCEIRVLEKYRGVHIKVQ